MSEQEIKQKCGELILEGQRIQIREEARLRRKPLTDNQSLFGIAIIIALFVMMVLTLVFDCRQAHAFQTEASYYTVASCLREGTSGICANGEKLDDESFICASWDYVFGTRLLVRNISTGDSIIVTVCDRGPSKKLYRRGRKLDLSRAAFSAISNGRLDRGVLQVEVTEI